MRPHLIGQYLLLPVLSFKYLCSLVVPMKMHCLALETSFRP